MKIKPLAYLLCFVWLAWSHAVGAAPQFTDYAVIDTYQGPAAKLKLRTVEDRGFRTALHEAIQKPADFAGHYVLWKIGCGTECLNVAAVDVKNGAVIWFPASLCCWYDSMKDIDPKQVDLALRPVVYRLNSRLLEVTGLLDETGENKTYYYELTDKAFVEIPSD